MKNKTVIIIGAGPAGLTAAYELLEKSDIIPVILEAGDEIGGISKTVNYKGNRMDIGGHRFFTKSEKVMEFWLRLFPVQTEPSRDELPPDRASSLSNPEKNDEVMLIRSRRSRIYYLRKFFDYPVTLGVKTLSNLGLVRVGKIILSYMKARLFPIRKEKSLEDFFVNRFGRELYHTFFKDYTEKVWGVPCKEIEPEWGYQRVKGLSVGKAFLHAAGKLFIRNGTNGKGKVETSLIHQFYYPKYGPGQLWEKVARIIGEKGGVLQRNRQVVGFLWEGDRIQAVRVKDRSTGEVQTETADYYISSMPVKDLVAAMGPTVPQEVAGTAAGLVYRDFMTVGLLLRKLLHPPLIPDNWIYIQEKEVKLGRLQIFNNWSPYMVKAEGTVFMGLEYFCSEGDELWNMQDDKFAAFAADELASIGIIDTGDVLDYTVVRMPKAYPAYFGTFRCFDTVRNFTDRFENLFLIGRNGMHRYNNMDHSMLTGMAAARNIIQGVVSKENIWAINTEGDYHEEK
jgi:protoporphyrinogen oxidase